MTFSRGFFVWSAALVPSTCLRDAFETEKQRKINGKSTKNQRKTNENYIKNKKC